MLPLSKLLETIVVLSKDVSTRWPL